MITFETVQAITFTLTSSLFLYMVVVWLSWFIDGIRPKKISAGASGAVR